MKTLTFEQWKKVRTMQGNKATRKDYDFYPKLTRWNDVVVPRIVKKIHAGRA